MRAARLHGPRDVRLDEVPVPEPSPGEVLVRVRAVSICASDVRMYWDGHAGGVPLEAPISQGHEFAGEITALGPGVERPPVGARVAVEPSWHCGACDMCESGGEHLCRNIRFPSFPPQTGALAEYIACPAHALHPIPDSIGDVEGALLEPLGVAIHAVHLARVAAGCSIAVLGAGAIGACILAYLRALGHERLALAEPVPGRREWAARFTSQPPVASAEEWLASGHEADLVLECAGENAAIEDALHLAKPAGTVVVVGIPHPERISLDANLPRRKELTVIFSRRSRATLPTAVALVAAGRLDLAALPVRRFALEQAAEAIEATASRPGDMLRAVVLP
ncbi:MAG: zinc-binding dehydrogenase [Armatimonadetes bacterium]|nr:zinc-binding dehydrogenase [Armatimonadota bacterium]